MQTYGQIRCCDAGFGRCGAAHSGVNFGRSAYGLLAVLVVLAAAGSHAAAHDPYHFKSLKADVYGAQGAVPITVRYDVRIKYLQPDAVYQLLVYATEKGHPILDDAGQPLQYVVPVGPAEFGKKGTARLAGQVDLDLLGGGGGPLKHLRVHAVLRLEGEMQPLAHKQTGVKRHKH